MGKLKLNAMLDRTSPRIKRSAAPTVRDRLSIEKWTTGSILNTRENEYSVKKQLNDRHRRKIGQWNVRGLNSLGKLSVLSRELERLDINICGLSETKWSDSGHFTTEDGHAVVFSGKAEYEHHGVAIWVHRRIASCLTSYNPVSSRIIVAKACCKAEEFDSGTVLRTNGRQAR